MKSRLWRWWWVPALVLIVIGFARLRFDVEVLDLLPGDLPSVHGLKLYQQEFANSRELLITVTCPDAATSESAAQSIAEKLRAQTNLVAQVTWQAPWLEHPEQTSELIAHLWLNQPPEVLRQFAERLAETNLPAVLTATREQLATTLSPTDLAQLSYDPFGFTRLPENVMGAAAGFGQGQQLFASANGTFHLLFIKAATELKDYRQCNDWLNRIKDCVNTAVPPSEATARQFLKIGYTGRPAFVAEISSSMQHDMTLSIGGTSLFIAILFWLAHRRVKPMLWLLILLALILAGTLAIGGLIFGTINVVSMGFAGILLGLAVDYAVVHYQEALAHPDLSIPEVRGAIAPSIFWAAVTTITAFVMLNFGGLPGLAQLGSLVGIGVALSACVMIFAFLPPLFPERRKKRPVNSSPPLAANIATPPLNRIRANLVLATTAAIIAVCSLSLFTGLPKLDPTANSLQPRNSQAYATLDTIKTNLNQQREPLWFVVEGKNESEVSRRLNEVEPILQTAVTNHLLTGFTLPTMLWPNPEAQAANRATIQQLVAERSIFHTNALAGGFSAEALGLTDSILNTWQNAVATTNVFWPTNQLSQWIFEKLTARAPGEFYAAGFMFPSPDTVAHPHPLNELESQLPHDGVWLSGWELVGGNLLGVVRKNLWKLVAPMVFLVLLSLWLAFRRFTEIFFSLAILFLSGLILLTTMKFMGWSWNLLNLMALPLILGTGVDYSIFMQLALRRHHGDLHLAHISVGRALLLCGATAVAGFGSLALSSNAGMSSLGQVCAVGIAGNMLISVLLLPVWWRLTHKTNSTPPDSSTSQPSSLYRTGLWSLGLKVAKIIPTRVCAIIAPMFAVLYRTFAAQRREIVFQNLLPLVNHDETAARRATNELFRQFSLKLADLWHFEAGGSIDHWLGDWLGWDRFLAAHARGKGVLLITPHLGNWEFGGAFLVRHNIDLLVLTQPEPEASLTKLREASRARKGIKTLVIGENPFAIVEIIKLLQAGATVALLIDRPPPSNAAEVELFGRPFLASLAAAELARAAGSAIIPGYIVRKENNYAAQILPEIIYDRAALGNRAARIRLTQEILRAFEPAIRQHLTQWYHFVPIWPKQP
ncbi:MAG TPA: MMPL family transporter [Verrucomicrobiae bacterium]|nr:MMPL family transporter [Verrucomicrobiae bacterium]